jgi:hypothetical protein
MIRYKSGRSHFTIAQFGILVNVATPGDGLALDLSNTAVDFCAEAA